MSALASFLYLSHHHESSHRWRLSRCKAQSIHHRQRNSSITISSNIMRRSVQMRGLGGRVVSALVFQSAIVRVGRFESRSPLGRAALTITGASVNMTCMNYGCELSVICYTRRHGGKLATQPISPKAPIAIIQRRPTVQVTMSPASRDP